MNEKSKVNLEEKLFSLMSDSNNRAEIYKEAIKLNNGSSENTCVYFMGEALRRVGEDIPYSVCNTKELLSILNKYRWEKEEDYKKLKKGDICFTTDEALDKNGIPSHTYIFMKWKEEGSYDYAYICDNQAKDYEGKIYHLRNIIKVEKFKGNQKEPFSFFIHK